MILILKSATSNETEEVAWSEDVVDFLIRHGAVREKSSINEVYIVDDVRAVHCELYRAKLI